MFGLTKTSKIKKLLGNNWKDNYKQHIEILEELYDLNDFNLKILTEAYDIGSSDRKNVMIYLLENYEFGSIRVILVHLNAYQIAPVRTLIYRLYHLKNDSTKEVSVFMLKNFTIARQRTFLMKTTFNSFNDWKTYNELIGYNIVVEFMSPPKKLDISNLFEVSKTLIPDTYKTKVLERDEYTCSICGKQVNDETGKPIFIMSRKYDNTVDIDNITSVCEDCYNLIEEKSSNGLINLTDKFSINGTGNGLDIPLNSNEFSVTQKCPQCNSIMEDDNFICSECGCNLRDYPDIIYNILLTKINYFKNLFDSIDFSKDNFDKDKMPLCYSKKSTIDYPMSNILVTDLLDWLSYLSQNDGIVSDEEVKFINNVLNLNLNSDDIVDVFINMNAKFVSTLPDSFMCLYEYDLANSIVDSNKKTVNQLEKLYMRIGESFINCEARFKSSEECLTDFELLGTYLSFINNNISDFKNYKYDEIIKENASNINSNLNNNTNNNFEYNIDNEKTLEEYIDELNKLIGLNIVKDDVNSLINLIQVRQVREQRGMKQPPMSLHLVFSGNPGTGKTTVARLLAKIYHKMGLLSKGHLIETDRSGLVGGYVGQTAIKTQEVIKNAMGGILFIDEAYTLSSSKGEQDYGQESIDTILKAMEDNREDLIVIVAGYPKLMQEFLQSNPGLQSRFNKFIYFEDYTAEELYKIFKSMCDENNLILDDKADEFIKTYFVEVYNNREENFANGREVRNLFEQVLSNQANRIASNLNISDEELSTLKYEDFN